MSVHDIGLYPAIKELLEIPEDEPIFILRAQDALAADSIFDYKKRVEANNVPSEFVRGVGQVIHDFDMWQRENPKRVKLPD
jgi:hypothetical protein